jgi:ABC-2 type transport system ATP-binding protein
VLLSTHNLAEVESACARAIIVSKGRIVADGPLDEIRARSGRVRYVVAVQESSGERPYQGKGVTPKADEVQAALTSIVGVASVGELPTDERAHAYQLASEKEVDLRPEIFRLVADKGWVLLELHRDSQTLEDVFRALTIGDERRNRRMDVDDEEEEETDEAEEKDEE